MFSLASKLDDLPVISLQTGEAVAWIDRPIFDPPTLEIVAFYCKTTHQKRPLLLMLGDVRQFAADCIIIDNEDELTEPEDIIRLKDTLQANFNLLDKPVISESGRKLGVVEDYTVNLETNRVQKLYVRQSLLQSWLGSNLTIDRTQIVDVTPQRIVVRDATVETPVMQTDPLPDVHP
jgi:sporulation protein YlmC with PRC-barrel domain